MLSFLLDDGLGLVESHLDLLVVLVYSEVLLQLAVLVGSLGDLFLGVLLGSGVLGEYFGLVYFLVDLHVATVETRDLV